MSQTHAEELVVADIGGTHARFAIAHIAEGRLAELSHMEKLRTADHASLQIAWQDYARQIGRSLPRHGAIAAAARVNGEVMTFTNSSWMLRPALAQEKLGLEHFTLINDFGAVAHAVAQAGAEDFAHLCGPEDQDLQRDGLVSVVGPGTGLGVAHIVWDQGRYIVTETEGGHLDFAPHDAVEDRILAALRKQHSRVSAERIVSGSGLNVIYRVLAEMEGQAARDLDDKALWTLALSGEDSLAAAAFDRFCLCLGSVVGDIALVQGAHSIVLAGGLGARIGEKFAQSGFRERLLAKGRFRWMMETMPVKRLLIDEPGLYGAAAAYLKEFPACET
ncbi:glucokinase [Alterisphingorhabdus coralli]|uniref:Glucokinase n=1 Tax=Alterisphingorhabdus coralli TaxID=3071408 RepID=A0AA97I0Z2_9SPHN|nr:glucokinase [Parasphingorhabdus sp. SCSIO 66989]WOE75512.1 glucokinase [Parasphingorhabdus sp. SCSIO 66989]